MRRTPGLGDQRAPNGIRTRAAALKGRCPRPLDDGGSTDLAALPVAPAVGDRISIGDERRCRQSDLPMPTPAHLRSLLTTGLPTRAAFATRKTAKRTQRMARGAPRGQRGRSAATLIDELLRYRSLLAFLGYERPRNYVGKQSDAAE